MQRPHWKPFTAHVHQMCQDMLRRHPDLLSWVATTGKPLSKPLLEDADAKDGDATGMDVEAAASTATDMVVEAGADGSSSSSSSSTAVVPSAVLIPDMSPGDEFIEVCSL